MTYLQCKQKLESGQTGKQADICGLIDTQKQILQCVEK